MNAQQLIDNCTPHGKIVWKELKEKVYKDMQRAAIAGEWKEFRIKRTIKLNDIFAIN